MLLDIPNSSCQNQTWYRKVYRFEKRENIQEYRRHSDRLIIHSQFIIPNRNSSRWYVSAPAMTKWKPVQLQWKSCDTGTNPWFFVGQGNRVQWPPRCECSEAIASLPTQTPLLFCQDRKRSYPWRSSQKNMQDRVSDENRFSSPSRARDRIKTQWCTSFLANTRIRGNQDWLRPAKKLGSPIHHLHLEARTYCTTIGEI